MKCTFCGAQTNMTCRDSYGQLYNCCLKCKQERKLNVSAVYKEEKRG